MRNAILFSTFGHVVVIALGWLGLPMLRGVDPIVEVPIVVEMVTIGEITNVPTRHTEPEPERKPEPEAAPKPPPVEKAKPSAPPPPPPPREEVAALPPPEPKPEPKAAPKPEPEAKPEAKPEPKVPESVAKAAPKRKPKPPDPFASVLKTVEEIKRQPRPEEPAEKTNKKAEPEKKEEFDLDQIAKAISRTDRFDASRPVTLSRDDALASLILRKISPCWNIPAGAKDAQDLSIEINLAMNPDGTVQKAEIQDRTRMQTDPFFRAAAESALRAVLNPRCSPLPLPREQYQVWQDLTLNFNPSQMF
jgi:hypothetical protein